MQRFAGLLKGLVEAPDPAAAGAANLERRAKPAGVPVPTAEAEHQVRRVRHSAHHYSVHPRRPKGVVPLVPLTKGEFDVAAKTPDGGPVAEGLPSKIQHRNNPVAMSIRQQEAPYLVDLAVTMLQDVKRDGGIYRHIPDAVVIGHLRSASPYPVTDIMYQPPNATTCAQVFLIPGSNGVELPMVSAEAGALMQMYVEMQTLALIPEKKHIGSWFSPPLAYGAPALWVETNLLTEPYLRRHLRFPLAERCRVDAATANEWQAKLEKTWSCIHAAKTADVLYSGIPSLTCRAMTRTDDEDDAREYSVDGMLDWTGFRIFIPD